MLGIEPKAARYVWSGIAVVLLLYLVYLARRTLFIFVLAVLFAYLLSPLVNLLDRHLPTTRTRTPALALAYVIFVAALGFLGFEVASTVADQAKGLAARLPAMAEQWEKPTPGAPALWNSLKAEVVQKLQSEVFTGKLNLLEAATQAGMKLVTVASDVVYVVIIPILAFFFLKDGRAIRGHILDMVDAGPRRALLNDLLADTHLLLAHYMRALVLLSAAAFAAFSIAFSILGVPYGVLLAAVAGLLEFVPMVGPLTAGVIISIVSLLSGSNVVVVVLFLLGYRVFQDYILSPHLMGRGIEIHPLVVLFGVFAGTEIAGIPGTFLSVPVLALVRILYLRVRRARLGVQLTAPQPVER
jgi:predicted PurR-regulated permease PerM